MSGGAGVRHRSTPRGKVRLDQRVLDLGLETTLARAQARIQAGEVRVAGQVVDKPGTLVAADALPELAARSPYVSRGGEKLAGALDALGVDPRGMRCLDAGVATGGFSDCVLQRGAARVLALDVGYGQLAPKLRDDPRVRVVERTNVRHFELPADEPLFDLVLADLSFISLARVLERLASFARPGGRLLVLVKPQFELEKGEVGKGGVVRDPAKRAEAVASVAARARSLGLALVGEAQSPLAGPKGNREVFLLLEKPGR